MARQPYLQFHFSHETAGRSISIHQIVDIIRRQIQTYNFPTGSRLPPVRVLAHQLGISRNVIHRAYTELIAQGLLESHPRVGLFVAPPQERVPVNKTSHVPSPDFINSDSWQTQSRDAKHSRRHISLSSVFVDPALLPKERLAACLRSASQQQQLRTLYDAQGFLPLRQKLAERLYQRGITADAEDIIITLGSQQAVDLVSRGITSQAIALENPAYIRGKWLIELNHKKPIALPVDPFKGLDLEDWRQRIVDARPGLLYLTPNFHNPTGYSYTTNELQHILDWSHQYGFGILEDDWGSDILSFSDFRPSLRAQGGPGVLYINSFTIKLLPSLRIGYLVGNPDITPTLVRIKSISCMGIPSVIEAALFEFLDRGYYDVHLKQLQGELDRRYRHCLNILRKKMPPGVHWTTPGGGSQLWVEVPKHIDLSIVQSKLKKRDVVIDLTHDAFLEPPHLNGFRIGYAYLEPATLQKGIEIVAEELHRCMA